jgi:uncharacterized protein YqgC (DUF456 family)
MEPTAIILWCAAAVLMAVGMVGVLLPALPGPPLVFLGALLGAWGEGFAYLGWGSLTVLGALAILAMGVDFLAGAFGVRRYGASSRAVLGASLGALVGLAFGVAGVIAGPFVGAVLGELSVRRNLAAAGRAGIGATIGLIFGTAAKLAIAFAMLGIIVVMRVL